MEDLLGSSIDHKNIELAKILFSLRHDLDIHCVIGVNATQINQSHPGRFFLGHVAMRALESIVLAICKVYEDREDTNSILFEACSTAFPTEHQPCVQMKRQFASLCRNTVDLPRSQIY
jgi:hypothetical protein